MDFYPRSVIFVLIIFSIGKISPKLYNRLDGYKMIDTRLIINILVTSERTKCCMHCTTVPECMSVSYNKHNGTCILSSAPKQEESLFERHANWEVWYQTNADEWMLVFRGKAGNGKSMEESWKGNSVSNCLTEYGSTCTDHYRSDVLDLWEDLNIQEVKVEIYKNNQKVAFLRFNGVSTDKMSWFSNSNLITSTWPSVTPTTRYNYFSINGDRRNSRRFFINHKYYGCQIDYGWLVVIDAISGVKRNCHIDKQTPYPSILYSTNLDGTTWNVKREYGIADSLNIYIKRT